MPFGTNATSTINEPQQPYYMDSSDEQWNLTAKKLDVPVQTFVDTGQAIPFQLPQVGVVAQLLVTLTGNLVIAEGGATPGDRWPYGILDNFALTVNGSQQILSNIFGEDLRVREDIAFPVFTEEVDVAPGGIGGGSAISAGTYPISLHWLIPIATELVTLAGALYVQNPSTNVRSVITPNTSTANLQGLFTANPTSASFNSGAWQVQEVGFVPAYNSQNQIIVPSGIQNFHTMTGIEVDLTAAANNQLNLIRGTGVLQRLFMSLRSSATQRLSAAPTAASDISISSLALSYGGNQIPYNWDPATILLNTNNRDYGFPAPYDYLLLDTLKWNPGRDSIQYAGLTELKMLATLNSAVSLSGGQAHLVQEDLF